MRITNIVWCLLLFMDFYSANSNTECMNWWCCKSKPQKTRPMPEISQRGSVEAETWWKKLIAIGLYRKHILSHHKQLSFYKSEQLPVIAILCFVLAQPLPGSCWSPDHKADICAIGGVLQCDDITWWARRSHEKNVFLYTTSSVRCPHNGAKLKFISNFDDVM